MNSLVDHIQCCINDIRALTHIEESKEHNDEITGCINRLQDECKVLEEIVYNVNQKLKNPHEHILDKLPIYVKHFKREYVKDKSLLDSIYKVLHIAFHSESKEKMVVYQNIQNNEIYVRPFDMFISKVDKAKYPHIKQEYRFEPLTEEEIKDLHLLSSFDKRCTQVNAFGLAAYINNTMTESINETKISLDRATASDLFYNINLDRLTWILAVNYQLVVSELSLIDNTITVIRYDPKTRKILKR